MSLTASTATKSDTVFHSDTEYSADDDSASVEAHFGDASSCSSASVHSIAGLEERELEAGHVEDAAKQSESDDSSESANNVRSSQILTTVSDSIEDNSSVTQVTCTLPVSVDELASLQLQHSLCDYEQSANAVCVTDDSSLSWSVGQCRSEAEQCAEKLQNRNTKLMSLRRASAERTALWCAVSTAMTSVSAADSCLSADVIDCHTSVDHTSVDHSVSNIDTDVPCPTTVAELVGAKQCDDNGFDKKLECVSEVGRASCDSRLADTDNCNARSVTDGSVEQSHNRLCDGGLPVLAVSDNDLLPGSAEVTSHQLSVANKPHLSTAAASATELCDVLAASCAVNLPLVEDGLSSGHSTDADDVDKSIVDTRSAACPVETSSEQHCQLPVEQLVCEIRSALRDAPFVGSIMCDDVTDDGDDVDEDTDDDDESSRRQPVWITRSHIQH